MLAVALISILVFASVSFIAKSGRVFVQSIPYIVFIFLFFTVFGSAPLTLKIVFLFLYLAVSSTVLLYWNIERESTF